MMPTVERTVVVKTQSGLHMKTASLIKSAVMGLDAVATISVNGDRAPATDPLKLTALNVPNGESVQVRATGPDADRAVISVRLVLSDGQETND